MNTSARYVIAVFAHNESHKIINCLEALRLSPLLPETICYVIANGCTDNTAKLTIEYAQTAPWVKVVDLEPGDKANAWNYFVHEMTIEANIYFFMDGDCQIDSGALQYLKEHLLANHTSTPSQVFQVLQIYHQELLDQELSQKVVWREIYMHFHKILLSGCVNRIYDSLMD